MGLYTAGWITVPGKGKRWRTSDGEYMMQRPAGSAEGVLGTIRNALASADRATGGWLPLPPGLDAQQPPVRELMDAMGIAALNVGNRVSKGIGKELVGYLGQTPEAQAKREQDSVRRTFNRQSGNNARVAPAQVAAGGIDGILGNFFAADAAPGQSKSYMRRSGLYDVDLARLNSGLGGDRFDPGGMIETGPSGVKGRDVISVGKNSPGWVMAHELGHLTDMRLQNPGNPFVVNQIGRLKEDIAAARWDGKGVMPRGVANSRLRAMTPPAIGLASAAQSEDRSLLQAAAEGAIEGLALNAGVLRNEFMADRYGKPLAERAGVKWDPRANALAKGSYIVGSAMPSATASVASELLNRGVNLLGDLYGEYVVDPVGRWMRGGDSRDEGLLRQYGYDPGTHRLKPDAQGDLEYVRRRGK